MIAYQLAPEPHIAEAHNWLVNTMVYDPVLLLASAYAWLDPVLLLDIDPDDPADFTPEDYQECIEYTMAQTRRFAPHLYVSFVQQDREIVDIAKLYDSVNAAISEYTGVVDAFDILSTVASGYVPYDCLGIDIENEDQFEQYDRLHPIVDLIGQDIADYSVAKVLIRSLESSSVLIEYNISILLRWLYSHTGNTLFDWDQEAFWENAMEPAEWHHAEYAIAVQQEAYDLHAEAMAGLDVLEDDEWLWRALELNVRYIRTLIESEEKHDDSFTIDTCWPQYTGDYRAGITDAQHDLAVLPFRPGPEERPGRVSG